jgi:hypothetical protein
MNHIVLMLLLFHLLEPKSLTFADFKGSGELAGYTVTEIRFYQYEDNGDYTFEVGCFFIPEESYITVKTEQILNHEIGHTRISAIWTNRIREGLKKYQHSSDEKKAKHFYNKMIRKWEWCETLYDMETDHSRNQVLQSKWDRWIAEQLNLVN